MTGKIVKTPCLYQEWALGPSLIYANLTFNVIFA